jgi:hypothetical protein
MIRLFIQCRLLKTDPPNLTWSFLSLYTMRQASAQIIDDALGQTSGIINIQNLAVEMKQGICT